MDFNIVGGSYQNKYISMNAQRTINWYVHKQTIQTEDDKFQQGLQPTPGLVAYANTAKNRIRKMFVARTLVYERCFVVADQDLFELDSAGTLTNRGTMSSITNDNTPVYMAVNSNNEVMICHSSASYIYQMATDTLTKITDADFPANPISLQYLQGYFIVVAGGRVYYSNLLNGLSWTATDVFTPSAYADKTIAAIVWRDDIHCFGTETIETYVNDGTTPFSKQDRSTINIGLVSVDSLVVFHDGMIFQGRMAKGQTKVYYYNGQTCTPISSFAIDWQLNNPDALSGQSWDNLNVFTWDQWTDAWGTTPNDNYGEIQYTKDGHIWYYLGIPALGTTYVFDVITQEWTERQSYVPANGVQGTFRGKYLVNFLGNNLWSDIYSGQILKEDYTTTLEVENPITRTRITKIHSVEKKNISIYNFELDCTIGKGLSTNPLTTANIEFYYSKDGGNTYSIAQNMSTGVSGNYIARPRAYKLGTARDWVFKLVQTDNSDLSINSAIMSGIVNTY